MKDESEKAGIKLNIQKSKIMESDPSLHGKQMGKPWIQRQTLFSWAQKSLWTMTAAMKLRCLLFGSKAVASSTLKNRDTNFLTKISIVKAMIFPSGVGNSI